MRWEGREQSTNVEDRRMMGLNRTGAITGGGFLILLIATFLGLDPRQIAQFLVPGGGVQQQVDPNWKPSPEEEKLAEFTKIILRDTEIVWEDLFARMGRRYEKPILRLYTDRVDSACGLAESAVGPFYCPGDARVYIDLGFYRDMQQKLNAPGDFARAYVVAHEVGHHVQKLLGYSQRVDEIRSRGDSVESHHASVRLELQADFFAGVWAYHAQKRFNYLDPGDVETALHAAFEIGDDRLQRKARGYVVPDSFTHGTSKQRQRWFMEGIKTGDVNRARALFDLPYGEL